MVGLLLSFVVGIVAFFVGQGNTFSACKWATGFFLVWSILWVGLNFWFSYRSAKAMYESLVSIHTQLTASMSKHRSFLDGPDFFAVLSGFISDGGIPSLVQALGALALFNSVTAVGVNLPIMAVSIMLVLAGVVIGVFEFFPIS